MKCIICDEVDPNEIITINSANNKSLEICKTCLDIVFDNVLHCTHCGKNVYQHGVTNNINGKVGSNGIVCSQCENNGVVVREGNFIFRKVYNNFKNYSFKPSPIFNKLDDESDDLYMGVELEIGGAYDSDIVRNFCDDHGGSIFYFKSDASIRGYGCEIVSHPATLAYHKSNLSGWNELFYDFNSIGFISGSQTNTGLHVHINKNVLNRKQEKKIDILVNTWHDLFETIGRRHGNSYCRFQNKFHNEWGRSNDRYQSVNFSNSHTVEFRFFCGTNDVSELFATLECVKAIVLLTKDITYDELYEDYNAVVNKMIDIVKENNFENFSKMMVKNTGVEQWKIQ